MDSCAQKLPDGINKMMDYYSLGQDFAYRCTNVHFEKEGDKGGDEIEVAFIYKKGNLFFYHTEDQEIIQNDKGTLTLYTSQKNAIYNSIKNQNNPQDKSKPVLETLIPNFMELIDSSQYLGVINGKKVYDLYPKYGDIFKIQVYLNSNYSIHKIAYFNKDTEYFGLKTELIYYPLSVDKINMAKQKINLLNSANSQNEIYKAFKAYTFIDMNKIKHLFYEKVKAYTNQI
jgi:hypothetical protein